MQQDSGPKYADGNFLSERDFDVRFECQFTEPLHPSKRKFKRDFIVENKCSFDIMGIEYHSWKNDFYLRWLDGDEYMYNNDSLDLKSEPWNEYDENAIAIYLYGRKLGYVPRGYTKEVSDIMFFSKYYSATLRRPSSWDEMCEIEYIREFHDTSYLPYQTDLVLTSSSINDDSDKYAEFIKACVGHTVTFGYLFLINNNNSFTYDDYETYVSHYYLTDEEDAFLNDYVSVETDMQSTIGFVNNSFIKRQCRKTSMEGFVEDVKINKENKQIEIKLRLLMEKSVINKNYLKSYQALEKYFDSFNDVGSYSIPFADLVKAVPRKTHSLSAYEPLLKYLKEYHAIQLTIV